jgi:hypothetical protein
LIQRAFESQLKLGVVGPLLAKPRFVVGTQYTARRIKMRMLSISIITVAAFASAMTIAATSANAVVCAAGVYRAGCAGPRGAAVVVRPPPVAACRYIVVNGVRVRRCV